MQTTEHEGKEYLFQFEQCKKIFTTKEYSAELIRGKEHVLASSSLSHKCPQCNKMVKALARHIKRVHKKEELPHKCLVCDKRFLFGSGLAKHFLVHIREYKCQQCPQVFTTKESLAVHQSNHKHVAIGPQKCPECGKMVKSLDQHIKVVHKTEQLPHKCLVCDKGFISASGLSTHMVMHTGDKPYQCQLCTNVFRRVNALKYHVRTVHFKEKRFKCDQCSMEFGQEGNLNNHLRSVHLKEKFLKCDVCSKTFDRKSRLVKHLHDHSKEQNKILELT